MARRSSFEILTIQTNNTALIWKDVHGIAPDNAAKKLDIAMLDWQSELTKTLKIWIDKGLDMTVGELILARANLGAVVESWLRFFYCVFYDDYINQPMKNKKGQILEPEKDMRFEDLKKFSTGILWDDEKSKDYLWVNSIQKKRNAIHSFIYKDIGTPLDFLLDVDYLCEFVDMILNHLPPVDDYVECYPAGYVLNVYFE
ncbi:MAG: hypothetical protein J6S14_14955 [Clostridia bacterium]|nr:hypothetical protein [Clostridia bacterium]